MSTSAVRTRLDKTCWKRILPVVVLLLYEDDLKKMYESPNELLAATQLPWGHWYILRYIYCRSCSYTTGWFVTVDGLLRRLPALTMVFQRGRALR